MNNFVIDKQPKLLYIINMMNDDFRDMMPTSEEFYAMMAKKDADFENAFKCDDDDDENSDAPTYDEVANTFAADAWHDAHEYPEW